MRRALLFLLKVVLGAPAMAAIVGWIVVPWFSASCSARDSA
jgi:integral membrane sensor domain MASE1